MPKDMTAFYVFLAALVAIIVTFFFYTIKLEPCTALAIEPLECHRMYMAFGVLFGLLMLLVFGAGLCVLMPSGADNRGKEVFDGFLKILPPIATLVLGYYFGSAQNVNSPGADKKKDTVAQLTDKDKSKDTATKVADKDKTKDTPAQSSSTSDDKKKAAAQKEAAGKSNKPN